MEQTKNEPKNEPTKENKAAPDTGKPKEEGKAYSRVSEESESDAR